MTFRNDVFHLTETEYRELCNEDIGLCRACGAERKCCESDARNLCCEECNEHTVYGAQELLQMDKIDITEAES